MAETRTQIEIVGIVPYTRADLFEKDPNGTLYLPFAGGFQSNVFFHIKFAPNAGPIPPRPRTRSGRPCAKSMPQFRF